MFEKTKKKTIIFWYILYFATAFFLGYFILPAAKAGLYSAVGAICAGLLGILSAGMSWNINTDKRMKEKKKQ